MEHIFKALGRMNETDQETIDDCVKTLMNVLKISRLDALQLLSQVGIAISGRKHVAEYWRTRDNLDSRV